MLLKMTETSDEKVHGREKVKADDLFFNAVSRDHSV